MAGPGDQTLAQALTSMIQIMLKDQVEKQNRVASRLRAREKAKRQEARWLEERRRPSVPSNPEDEYSREGDEESHPEEDGVEEAADPAAVAVASAAPAPRPALRASHKGPGPPPPVPKPARRAVAVQKPAAKERHKKGRQNKH
jgi:hypothetical protein